MVLVRGSKRRGRWIVSARARGNYLRACPVSATDRRRRCERFGGPRAGFGTSTSIALNHTAGVVLRNKQLITNEMSEID